MENHQTEQLLSEVINSVPSAVFIINEDGVIYNANNSAIAEYGTSMEEITGRNFFKMMPEESAIYRNSFLAIVKSTDQQVVFEDSTGEKVLKITISPLHVTDQQKKFYIFSYSDITDLRRDEDLLYRYNQILSTVMNPVAIIDNNRRFKTVNHSFLEFFNLPQDCFEILTLENIVDEKDYKDYFQQAFNTAFGGSNSGFKEWITLKNRRKCFINVTIHPLFNMDRAVSGVVLSSIDMTENKELEEKLTKLSITDPLTGIFNRNKMNEALTNEINRVSRHYSDMTLMMFDIDHFKRVNDTYGHDTGDKVLKGVVRIADNIIRKTDTLARWGGEEFMLLLPVTDIERGKMIAERIRLSIEQKIFPDVGRVTCSFGIGQYNTNESMETFINRVDSALYEAKRSGRNRIAFSKGEGVNKIN